MLELQEKKAESKEEKNLRNYKYNKHYIFHPEHGEKLVSSKEYQENLANGWYDCTSKFPKTQVVAKAKVDEKEALIKQLQAVIDSQSKVIDDLKGNHKVETKDVKKGLVDAEGMPAKKITPMVNEKKIETK